MNFIVYTKDNCPYCTKIKYVLERLEVQHQVYKLDVDFDREQFYEKFGMGSTFPQIIADGKCIGGCIDTISYLKENNIL